MLMIFDPRDARSAYYSAVFAVVRVRVCPSVRPSHASIISKRIHILKLFDHLVAPYHSSFLTPCVGIQFQGEPFERGRNTRTYGKKKCNFRLKSPFISETVRDRPIAM